MAGTVLDEFVLEIGLDGSKFAEGRRHLDDEVDKSLRSVEKFGKTVEQSGAKISEIFGITKTGVAGIVATFMGAEAGAFVEKIRTMEASTSRLADSIGLNRRELTLWQNMIGLVGGTAADANQTIAGLNDALMQYRSGLGQPSPGFAQLMSQAGVNYLDQNLSATDVLTRITRFLSTMPEQDRRLRLQQVPGMSESMMFLLLKGAENVNKFAESLQRFSANAQESGDAAQRMDASLGRIGAALRSYADVLLPDLAKALDWVANVIESRFGQFLASVGGGFSFGSVAGGLIGGVLGSVVPGWGTVAGAGIGAAIGGAAGGAAGGITWGSYQGSGASSGGSRGDRNNNPGNIKYGAWAAAHGATGQDSGGFAIFPDARSGVVAMAQLLHDRYQGMTLAQIQQRWVGNVDTGYLGSMMSATGMAANAIPDLNDPTVVAAIIRGMSRGEGTHLMGASGSKVQKTSSVTIQNLNVTSSKADPKAVADQIPDAIRRSSMMNSVNTGLV